MRNSVGNSAGASGHSGSDHAVEQTGEDAAVKAQRLPWAEAVRLFGEPALKCGHSHQRVSNWRREGVPGSILLPLFMRRVRRENPMDYYEDVP